MLTIFAIGLIIWSLSTPQTTPENQEITIVSEPELIDPEKNIIEKHETKIEKKFTKRSYR